MYGALEVGTFNRVLGEDYAYPSGFRMVDINATVQTSAGIDTSNHLVIQDIKRQGVQETQTNLLTVLMKLYKQLLQLTMYHQQFGVLTYYESLYRFRNNQWVPKRSAHRNIKQQLVCAYKSILIKNAK